MLSDTALKKLSSVVLCNSLLFDLTQPVKWKLCYSPLNCIAFCSLVRTENLPDIREEAGSWCAVWLFSDGTARRGFWRSQPLLLSSDPHTRPHPWRGESRWASAATPTTWPDWGKRTTTYEELKLALMLVVLLMNASLKAVALILVISRNGEYFSLCIVLIRH